MSNHGLEVGTGLTIISTNLECPIAQMNPSVPGAKKFATLFALSEELKDHVEDYARYLEICVQNYPENEAHLRVLELVKKTLRKLQ